MNLALVEVVKSIRVVVENKINANNVHGLFAKNKFHTNKGKNLLN